MEFPLDDIETSWKLEDKLRAAKPLPLPDDDVQIYRHFTSNESQNLSWNFSQVLHIKEPKEMCLHSELAYYITQSVARCEFDITPAMNRNQLELLIPWKWLRNRFLNARIVVEHPLKFFFPSKPERWPSFRKDDIIDLRYFPSLLKPNKMFLDLVRLEYLDAGILIPLHNWRGHRFRIKAMIRTAKFHYPLLRLAFGLDTCGLNYPREKYLKVVSGTLDFDEEGHLDTYIDWLTSPPLWSGLAKTGRKTLAKKLANLKPIAPIKQQFKKMKVIRQDLLEELVTAEEKFVQVLPEKIKVIPRGIRIVGNLYDPDVEPVVHQVENVTIPGISSRYLDPIVHWGNSFFHEKIAKNAVADIMQKVACWFLDEGLLEHLGLWRVQFTDGHEMTWVMTEDSVYQRS